MRYRLDGNRELLLERLRDKLGIEKQRYKADVLDAALVHLYEDIENREGLRGEVDPTVLKQLNTSVVNLKYRTLMEMTPTDVDSLRLV